jgi:glycosidase
MGYDISDYRSIDPIYGTMEDFDTMLKAIHSKGMKLMSDEPAFYLVGSRTDSLKFK